MTTPKDLVREYFEIESLGFDTSDTCMLPDCGCDGEPHDF